MGRINRNLPYRHMDARPLLRSAEYQVIAEPGEKEGKGCSEIMGMNDWKIWGCICLDWEPMRRDIWGERRLALSFSMSSLRFLWHRQKRLCRRWSKYEFGFEKTAAGWFNTLHTDFDFPPTFESPGNFPLFQQFLWYLANVSRGFVGGRFSDSQLASWLGSSLNTLGT